MIKSFFDHGTEDIFDRIASKEARATCPKGIWRVAQRKLDQLNAVVSIDSLRIPPGNKLEALKGDRRGQYSIRINDPFRICFVWTPDGPERVRSRIIIRSAPSFSRVNLSHKGETEHGSHSYERTANASW